jgi:hypothetical protein
MFTQVHINRNPDMSLLTYVPGYEYSNWALT